MIVLSRFSVDCASSVVRAAVQYIAEPIARNFHEISDGCAYAATELGVPPMLTVTYRASRKFGHNAE